jgi:hypothetical protein
VNQWVGMLSDTCLDGVTLGLLRQTRQPSGLSLGGS